MSAVEELRAGISLANEQGREAVVSLDRAVSKLETTRKRLAAATQPYTSGNDQTWTPLILERARVVGLPARFAGLLGSHVEMKAATSMIQGGRQHSELVINHVPCGSQANRRPGCHQALEKYLPEGHTLTVHGTTQGGEPYSHTYHGRAQR